MTSSFPWLLVVILRNSLREAAGQTPPQGFRYASYEVTIPRKLTPKYGFQDPQDVSYWLQIEGKGHTIHLRQKRNFVLKHFPVFTYSKAGDIQVDYPFIRDDCFYHGFVQYKPLSLVTLSTCSGGLRGLLRLDNKTYEIQPVQPSNTFQHVVYRLEEEAGAVRLRCGLTEEEMHHQEAMIHSTKNVEGKINPGGDWWTHTRYVKVAIVVDRERYIQFEKNETLVLLRVMDVMHIANSFYESLNVLVTAAGLEIWSERNLITISNSIEETLDKFTAWRRNTLVKRLQNDVGHLFVYKSFGSTLGLAYVGQVCTNWAAAVESYMSYSLFFFANTFSHELGHNLGMRHDEKYCTCGRKACIMAPSHSNSDQFSNCSYKDYFRFRNSPCLLIPPDPSKVYKRKYCGNKVVDDGEQCDCGSKFHCELDACCQSNCMLRSGATCAFGLCCAKCQYRPAGTICREKIGNCDLPEYCNGTSEQCPEDVFVQDGAPCMDNSTHCYHGNCSTHNGQCQMIFGKKARAAPESCFNKINAQGDRFGNCGLRHGIYKNCEVKNSLCGRIQCDNVYELPSLEEHSTIIQTPDGKRLCWGTDYHSGINIIDIGAVRDGTPCGIGMMCVNGECISVSFLKNDCNVTKCHYHGICNSRQNCHCSYGWAPPDCLNKGYGGSIDSGPPPKHGTITNARVITIEGIVFILLFAFCAGCGMFYRYGVRQQFRTSSTSFHQTGWTQEGSPQ